MGFLVCQQRLCCCQRYRFLTKSLSFFLSIKTRGSDVRVKTYYLREAEKQLAAPSKRVPLQSCQKTMPNSISFPLFPVHLSINLCGSSVFSIANFCHVVAGSTSWSKVDFFNCLRFYNVIKYPTTWKNKKRVCVLSYIPKKSLMTCSTHSQTILTKDEIWAIFKYNFPKKWSSVTQEAKSGLWISSSVISCRLRPCGTYQNNMFYVVISICFLLRPNASEWLYTDITLQTLQQEGYLPWLVPCLWSHWSSPLLEKLNRNMKKGGSIFQNFPWIQISFTARVCHSGWVGPGFLSIWLYIQWDPFLPFLWLCGNGQVPWLKH